MPLPVIAVVGPTAAGKSELSLYLAAELDGEIINADSMQLYRGMDIGTAKLPPGQRAGVPHHLLDSWDVTTSASVSEYQRLARAAIAEIHGRGRVPILVGGSGLYVRAALDRLEFPGTDPALRGRLEDELSRMGSAALHRRLAERDPAAAAVILPGNGRRIVRALEVIELSGAPFTAELPQYESIYDAVQIGIEIPRPELDARIAVRVTGMWELGLVEEVRRLAAAGLREGRTASRALGYAQVLRFLDGEWTQQQAIEETVRATRRFARRQESWFRRDPRICWLDGTGQQLRRQAAALARADDPPGPAGQPPARTGTVGSGRARSCDPAGPSPAAVSIGPMRFAKGHGTGNDFVLLPDPDGRLDLTPELVRRICARHAGLGADGVLRVVRAAAAAQAQGAGQPQSPGQAQRTGQAESAGDAEWFMDYRNGDGSIAEMCGNGIRVFVRYLLDHGLAAGPVVPVATRAGVRAVRQAAGRQLTVDMGPAAVLGGGKAVIGGRPCAGLAISVGNPHLACVVDEPLAGFDLDAPPQLDQAQFPAGANVELVRISGERQAEMRVHERGSGVTLSCGTGAVAAAVAASAAAGEWPGPAGPPWTVTVPGGRLAVTPSATASLLTGPAVIVAEGDLDARWLAVGPGASAT